MRRIRRPRRGRWCSTTRPSRSSRTSSSAATRAGRARPCRGGSSACWPVRSRPPFQKGSGRLELAQAIADAKNPLDGPGAGQPRLAVALRQGTGHHAQRLRPAQRPAEPSRAARYLASEFMARAGRSRRCTGGSCSRARISSAATPRPDAADARPREPAVLAVQSPAARFRVDARLAPGRLGRARARDRGPGRRRSPSPRFRRGARSTASSTARTSTASTGPSTSPCPTRPARGGS